MALGVGLKCIKYMLFIFNLLFVLAAIAFIALGAAALNVGRQLGWMSSPTAIGVFIIAIGVIIFMISFFGCCGAARESYCLIIAFTVSLSIIFILQLTVGIFGVVARNQIETELPQLLNSTMNYYTTNVADQRTWDFVQTSFNCCGLTGPSDWQNRGFNNTWTVPDSCCITAKRNTSCGYNVLSYPQTSWNTYINTNGCYTSMSSGLSQSVIIIGVVALVLCFVQLMGITCASCLAHEIHNQYQPM